MAAMAYLIMFGIIGIMAAQQSSSGEMIYKEAKAEIAVIDESPSEASQHFTAYLAKNNILLPAPAKQDIDEQIYMGLYDVIIVVPEGFEKYQAASQLEIYKSTFSSKAYKALQDISSYMFLLNISRDEQGAVRYELLDGALQEEAEIQLIAGDVKKANKAESFRRAMNASLYPVIAMVIFVVGMVMSDFNHKKVAFRNKCSGKSLRTFQTQMFLGQILFGALLWFLVMGMNLLVVKGMDFSQSDMGLYGLNMAVFIMTILSFSFFLNNIIRNKHTLSAISNIFALGSAFVSGAFIPLEFLDGFVLKIAAFLPSYYFVLTNEAIFSKNQALWRNMGIQLLFAAAFLALGYYLAKLHQRESALEM